MIRSAHPMECAMVWPRHHAPEDVASALSGLPAGYSVTPIGSAHLVLGVTGAQVVAMDDGHDETPRAVARLASVIRSALAEHVAWVPFVHALLVTERTDPCPPATAIPPTLLVRAVVDGPLTIQPDDLARLVGCIEDGALDGLGSVAPHAPRDRALPASS
jgi:hypothetical protein